MGIPGISLVLKYVKNKVRKQIDLLIFDTCLFNNIGLLYKLEYYSTPAPGEGIGGWPIVRQTV